MLVISKYSFNTPGSIALNKRLNEEARELSEEAGLATGVAGGAAQLNDYSRVTRERIPCVIAAITLVTFLVLIVVLRAIPLAAIAVGLNLATVGGRLRRSSPCSSTLPGGLCRWAATPTSTRSGR